MTTFIPKHEWVWLEVIHCVYIMCVCWSFYKYTHKEIKSEEREVRKEKGKRIERKLSPLIGWMGVTGGCTVSQYMIICVCTSCSLSNKGRTYFKSHHYCYCWQYSIALPSTFVLLPKTFDHALQTTIFSSAAQFLKTLVSIQGARRVLEVGMFTGYSALAMAEALPPDGVLVTCDTQDFLRELNEKSFANSPHGKKIQIKIGTSVSLCYKTNPVHHLFSLSLVFLFFLK